MRRAVGLAVLAVMLAVPAFAVNRSWTGAVDASWSNLLNWSPPGVPAATDDLTFPATQSRRSVTFDMPAGTSVGPMAFLGDYELSGNRMTLTGDVSFAAIPAVSCIFDNDLTIGASLTFSQAQFVTLNGAVNVNGQTLSFVNTNTTVLNGPLTGTGTINAGSRGLSFLGSGTFAGNVEGYAYIGGSYPNASFHGPWITGTGRAGAVSAALLSPGQWRPEVQSEPHNVGWMYTGPLSIASQLSVDIQPLGNLEQLIVTGPVSIAGTLAVTVVGTYPPVAGDRYPIIDNDGTDPVQGTFDGLPEGATLTAGNYPFRISYKGGDGNDVVLTAGAATKTWTGRNSDKWSDPANWDPQAVPAGGEPLLFPPVYGVPTAMVTNDLPAGFNPGPLTFNGNYTVGGNLLLLTNDVHLATNPYTSNLVCNAPLKLGSSIHLDTGPSTTFISQSAIFNGPIDMNGNTLSVATVEATFRGAIGGSGAIDVAGPGISIESSGSFSGPISGSTVNVVGAYPNATVTGTRVSGEGTLGAVTAGTLSPGSWLPSGDEGPVAPRETRTLQTGSLSISSQTIADIDPANGSADQIKVAGTVSIAGALQLSFMSAPSPGQSWTLIDNDGADPVSGTFSGLPEGATFTTGYGGSAKFRITYKGGDGNDIVVSEPDTSTPPTPTTTTIAQDRDTTDVSQPVTFTATVTSSNGTPTGTVTFTEGSAALDSVLLQNGSATFTTSDLAPGDHQIYVTYGGAASFAPSSSPAIVHHVITAAATTTTVTQDHDTTQLHQPVTFTATVTSGNGTPAGVVTFLDGSAAIGSAPLQSGSAALTTKDLGVGDHQITASYGGNASFAASSSAPIVHHVGKGQAQLTATPSSAHPAYGDSVAYLVSVERGAGVADAPGGSVTLEVDRSPAGSAALSPAGAATINLPLLGAGTHSIHVAYSGDGAFDPASAASSLIVSKAATRLSIDSPMNPSPAGVPVTLSVRVNAAAHPALPSDGTVVMSSADRIMAQAQLANGAAAVPLVPLGAGEHQLAIAYAGNDNFEAATASLTQHVDAPPALSIADATLTVAAAAPEQSVQVELSAASPLPVSVDYRTADRTAAAGADYVPVQGTLTFAPGQTEATIPIRLLSNPAAAQSTSFEIELSNASGASLLARSATVTIANEPRPYRAPVSYAYATVDGLPLRVTFYVPAKGDGPWPVIVWIPGDAAYDAAGGDIAALRETARGYAVVSAGYRPAAAAPFPAQIDDLRAAVAWLRANAALLGVDARRVAAWGVGAGGHLAALLGGSADVRAVVDWSGIGDPSTLQSDALACSTIDWNAPGSPASLLLGCPPSQCPAAAAAASPAHDLAANAAPMLLMHGAADCVIAPNQSMQLYEAMKHAGANATLSMIDGVGHHDAFWTTQAAFDEVDAFLDARLKGSSARPRPVRH